MQGIRVMGLSVDAWRIEDTPRSMPHYIFFKDNAEFRECYTLDYYSRITVVKRSCLGSLLSTLNIVPKLPVVLPSAKSWSPLYFIATYRFAGELCGNKYVEK